MDDAPEVLALLARVRRRGARRGRDHGNLRLAPPLPIDPEELHGKPIVALVVTLRGSRSRTARRRCGRSASSATPALDARHAEAVRGAPEDVRRGAAPRPPLLLEVAQARRRSPTTIIDVAHASTPSRSRRRSPPWRSSRSAAPSRGSPRTPRRSRTATRRTTSTSSASWLPDDPEPERHIEWVRGFFDALEPHSRGVYVNYVSDDVRPTVCVKTRTARQQWQRLVALKAKYDPTNFFRLNANIPPKGQDA